MGRPAEAPLKIDSKFRPGFTVSLITRCDDHISLFTVHGIFDGCTNMQNKRNETLHTSHRKAIAETPFADTCIINSALSNKGSTSTLIYQPVKCRACCVQPEQTRQKHCPSFPLQHSSPVNMHKATESSYKCLNLFWGPPQTVNKIFFFFLPCSRSGLSCLKHLT